MSEHDTNKSDLDTPTDQAITVDQGTTSGADSATGVDATNSADPTVGSDATNNADPTVGTDVTNSVDPTVGTDAAVNLDASGGFDLIGYLDTVINFFQTGGTFMYPILIVFALGLAISIERYIKLTYERRINRLMWNRLQPLLADADFETARDMVANDDKSTISKIMIMGLERQGVVRRRDDIEIAMEESMMEIIPQLEKRTPYIALFSNICTLLGLLGTIMGLIEAFTAVANANPAEKADLLSASISVAMNTTAFGLMAGIPLLIIHAFLTSRTSDIVNGLEMASVKTLNIISSSAKRKGDAGHESPPDITMISGIFDQSELQPQQDSTEEKNRQEDSSNTDKPD